MARLLARTRDLLRLLAIKTVGKVIAWPVRRQLFAFDRMTEDPAAVQSEVRDAILRAQSGTAFGVDHHFADIHTRADFARHIPVAGYEYVEPYIQRVLAGEV